MARTVARPARRTSAAGRSLPRQIEPMLAQLSDPPADADGWAFETKWDGVRALIYNEQRGLRATSRNHNDITALFPELKELEQLMRGRPAVLDAEVVALDSSGASNFQRLQSRMGLKRPDTIAQRAAAAPATVVVFDVLHLDGRDLTALPWCDRRQILESLPLSGSSVRVSDAIIGKLDTILRRTRERGLEGVIAKRVESPYRQGSRGRDWLKIKHVRRQEFVIGGWTEGEGSRAGRIGALLLGYHDRTAAAASSAKLPQQLVYAGSVGTGFKRADLEQLAALLAPLERDSSPFDVRSPGAEKPIGRWQAMNARSGGVPRPQRIHFAEPELVAEVGYAEFTRDGTLRHPSFKGLREDKPATDVVREDDPTSYGGS